MGDTITVNRAFQTAWIVYINGLEVPVNSVSVRYGVWNVPEAEITLLPDPIMQRFGAEDRVSVQVFYCDYWQTPEQPEFRLMFDGEIVAWSYANVKNGRALSLSCVDYIQIFTQLFFFFMSNVDDIAIGESNAQIGVGVNQVNTAGYGAIYPYSLFAEGLISNGDSAPLITRPVDFLYNIVRALIQYNTPNRSVPAANFFAPWTRRTNFHRRFIGIPFLEEPGLDDESGSPRAGVFPILRAVRADFAVAAVARLASRVGSAGSIWEILQQIMQTLMMEIQMLPTPSAITSNYDKLSTLGPATRATEATKPVMLTNYFVKPQFLFGLPPACNVFFPSQISRFAYDENFITQPTRMYFAEEAILGYLNVQNNVDPGLGTLIRDALTVAHPEEVHLAARAAQAQSNENGKNLLVYPEEFFKGPVVDRRSLPTWFTFLEQAQQDTRQAPAAESDDVREVSAASTELNVYRKYAQYEYFKERYSRRTSGLELAFNPYPVPGFPCVVFDDRDTQVDIIGYVMSVEQVLHAGGWSTRVSISYGRTLKEMFKQVQAQIDSDNQNIQVNESRIAEAVQEGTQTALDNEIAVPVGAIATAPPEPILEIRDVIQNFQRAEAFYRSLFFRVPAPADLEISQQQLRAEADRRASHAAGTAPSQPRIEPPPVNTATDTGQLQVDLGERRASFWYHELIEFVNPEGSREEIQLEGFDASSRIALLSTLQKMRVGQATEEELSFVRESVGRPTLAQQPTDTAPDPAITQEINSIEVAVRTATVKANLDRGQYITPKESARSLFEGYEAAMRYNARPICTLDEYIKFLGEDAQVEGRIDPKIALVTGDSRTFPAHYYFRIRRYTPGPPDANTPVGVISNTEGRSTPDGSAIEGADEATVARTASPIEGLPDNFPQTTTDWDSILLIYRANALNRLPPRS